MPVQIYRLACKESIAFKFFPVSCLYGYEFIFKKFLIFYQLLIDFLLMVILVP